jgi:hypothetical protein
MKGCAIFAAIFVLGVGLTVGGIVYDMVVAQNLETQALPARILELAGLVLVFGAIFGLAGWAFSRRLRDQKQEQSLKLTDTKPHRQP